MVDDEEDLVDIIGDVLTPEGYQIVKAHDGEAAIEMIEQVHPDLLVLDINMPKKSGIEVYHTIANRYDGSPKIPVIVLTARNNLKATFSEFKVDGFMEKPFDMDRFLVMVKEALDKHAVLEDPEEKAKRRTALEQKSWKILLADREKETSEELFLKLEHIGHEVQWISTIEDSFFFARKKTPEVILVSLNNSTFTGPELTVAKQLSCDADTADIPVFFYVSSKAKMNVLGLEKICGEVGVRALFSYHDITELTQKIQKELLRLAVPLELLE